jgi:glycine amidinotransferase
VTLLAEDDNLCVPVNSHNEWDPLEEVIVGVVEGAQFPPWHVAVSGPLSNKQRDIFKQNSGRAFPEDRVLRAARELDQLIHILEGEGVKVRRPTGSDQSASYGGPGWTSTGLYDAMPRDVLLVLGNEILECPMAWRSRYFATSAFRPLLKEYFAAGAKWSAAPKPELRNDLYCEEPETVTHRDEGFDSVITEFEPTFDAADVVRCGRDLFVQRSNVTNSFGIEWLRRHVNGEYRLHILEFDDPHPMHIDATFMPLAPGKVLINPERVELLPKMFKGWDVLTAPKPIMPSGHLLYMTSAWINMNVLMLDERRVIVEREDEPMLDAMKRWGLTPIPCSFRNFNSFGGSFHCATLDVYRRGTLQSYF